MVRPNLLNSILVEVEQIDKDATVYDPRKREPVGVIVWSAPFKISAQIFFGKEQFWSSATAVPDPRTLGGVLEIAEGYIVVSKLDLQRAGKTLSENDLVISYGKAGIETPCELVLVGSKSAAHYADIGQCTIEKWWFKDKNGG